MNIKFPVKAHHRYIKKLIELGHKGKVDPDPKEFDRVTDVFERMGGSWERLFKGSPEDVAMLKKVIKFAVKNKVLSRKNKW